MNKVLYDSFYKDFPSLLLPPYYNSFCVSLSLEVCSVLIKTQNNVNVSVHQRQVLWNICYEYNVWICLSQVKPHALVLWAQDTLLLSEQWKSVLAVIWWWMSKVFYAHRWEWIPAIVCLCNHGRTLCCTDWDLCSFVWLYLPTGHYFMTETSKLLPEPNCTLTAHSINFKAFECNLSVFAQFSLEWYAE